LKAGQVSECKAEPRRTR